MSLESCFLYLTIYEKIEPSLLITSRLSYFKSVERNQVYIDGGLFAMSLIYALHGLGLGGHIYGSPVGKVNSNKELFQIPKGYKAVVVLRIGNVDKNVDAVSAASPRKAAEEVINYKK